MTNYYHYLFCHSPKLPVRVHKTICTTTNNEQEIHLLLAVDNDNGLASTTILEALLATAEQEAQQQHAAMIFQRVFLRRDTTQQRVVIHAFEARHHGAVSIIVQPPANGTAAALWVYLATGTTVVRETDLVIAQHRDYTQYLTTNLLHPHGTTYDQTTAVFQRYIAILQSHHLTLANHCQRTWLFVNDIDHNYSEMVAARNDIFDTQQLTTTTHFLASTGIAGSVHDSSVKVVLDAIAYNINRQRVSYLYAKDHLNNTADYGVRFERGTQLTLPHATQVIISGTASIDNKGQIVHPDNVIRQAQRMMTNVAALLQEAQATVQDIQMALIYLRYPADYHAVATYINTFFPELPYIILHAPVCRTQWRIELECLAMR